MKIYLEKILNKSTLKITEAKEVMEMMSNGSSNPEEMAAFLSILKYRGETADEIAGFAQVLRSKSLALNLDSENIIDTCGTGGTGKNTFNISTTVALICASAGIKVAKHGNRAVSSKCGSADLLEKIGIKIDLPIEKVKESLERFNFSFLFAPNFHPAFKHIAPVRKKLGIRTVFNILGPLLNPAQAKRQVIGVYDLNLVDKMAQALNLLGTKEAFIVHSKDGMDEISLSETTNITHLKDGEIKQFIFDPRDYGFEFVDIKEIKGGDSDLNQKIILDILHGQKSPCRDIVVLNAAAAFIVSGKTDDWHEAISLVKDIIDSGKTMKLLENLREFSNEN